MTDQNGGVNKGSDNNGQVIEPRNNSKNRQDENVASKVTGTTGRVQLRSDVILQGVKGKVDKRMWWLIGGAGVVVLAVITGLVVSMVLAGRAVKVDNDDNGGLFDQLPQVLEEAVTLKRTSGLSGRECAEPNRRPIGVMLSSDVITRPVSGFAAADMVWELPVLVSDVTRLLAVYQCGQPSDIGSVRSVRHDYLFLAEGVDAIVGHWGGSYHALNRISAGEFDTINALTNPFSAYFRKNHLPAPYNGFTTYENLWNALQKLGYRTETTFKGYEFKDDAAAENRSAGGRLSIAWPGAFRVHYEYDPQTNRYQRFWGGVEQVDGGPGKEKVAPSVVAVIRATNQFADGPGGYNDMGIEGSGVLEVYQDGQVIKGTWQKNELYKAEAVKFLDGQGKEIVFTRGQVWVMAVEPEITVTWEPKTVEPSATASPAGSAMPITAP
ncbi:MAG: hypothetical protein A3E37_03610 [Candidatus Andersenbacteria bacterium RIFCSPHIGHO2_12_FULL_46_9]|nr:MAG: hypothetical protein UW94_C0001G0050 [Parcubacteria group bacterium GW2011_GWA2_45_14]OGY35797.1 MAG: hypothetical protein A3B76_03740 [Candidatus Andersenbacteria bacterium RIFCSPHIGHO2_02_FULL_46_16]OGY36444.1 MAG: hypothetical protein A3E37_03610 [Candidatus Andersenbacteria bacterium RIFCSPHIGHO2_12_FULL_46_9]OGY42556.1 MAG: hypothetical protein A3G57_02960 [Candidatus Andersenbacteria bacterium RIFCSPLOWO2_12_FULL_45_8]HBE90455.1 hypothetical protein [Candidatus Andersenbacteria ba